MFHHRPLGLMRLSQQCGKCNQTPRIEPRTSVYIAWKLFVYTTRARPPRAQAFYRLLRHRRPPDRSRNAFVVQKKLIHCPFNDFPGSIVVSISACHAEDRGSIPRQGASFATFMPCSSYRNKVFSPPHQNKSLASRMVLL